MNLFITQGQDNWPSHYKLKILREYYSVPILTDPSATTFDWVRTSVTVSKPASPAIRRVEFHRAHLNHGIFSKVLWHYSGAPLHYRLWSQLP